MPSVLSFVKCRFMHIKDCKLFLKDHTVNTCTPLNLLRHFFYWYNWITFVKQWSGCFPRVNLKRERFSFQPIHSELSSWSDCWHSSHALFVIVSQRKTAFYEFSLARMVELLCWWQYREPLKMLSNCCWREEPRSTLQIMPRSKCPTLKCDY